MSTNPETKSIRKIAHTHRHEDTGVIHALSSNGVTVYVVRIGIDSSCTCPAGRNGRRCYHVATAEQRYPGLYRAPWAVLVPETRREPEPPNPTCAPQSRVCPCVLY